MVTKDTEYPQLVVEFKETLAEYEALLVRLNAILEAEERRQRIIRYITSPAFLDSKPGS